MIDRKHIEEILRINGLAPTAADEEIRSVLISAKWQEKDVQTALTVLRESESGDSHVDTLHNVFVSDKKLSPESIQSLLGIDLEINSKDIAALKANGRSLSLWQIVAVILVATFLATGSIMAMMYVNNFGLFHPSMTNSGGV